ncbi:MAG: AAA family ATPase [Syntrophales bacterium]|nr:AAA family ATPase [Syntrophales bacterium]
MSMNYQQTAEDQAREADGQVNRFTAAMITGGTAIEEQFQRLLSQRWTVKKWIPETAWLVEIFGPPGTYKSFITLDVALSIATGHDWQGQPVKRLRVVYIPAEGQSGTLKRVKAWLAYHKISSTELNLFTILPRPCLIDQPGELDALIEALTQLPEPPVGFIVIDTLARSMSGDENSTSDMGSVVNACARLSEETGHAQIALVHHTGKDEARGPRGALALTGATDVLIGVQKPYDRAAVIHCERQKDDEPPPGMFFNMAVQGTGHLNDDGEELSSLVPVHDPFSTTAKTQKQKLTRANRVAFNALDAAMRDHGKQPSNELMEQIREGDPPDAVVHEDDWRQGAYNLGISDGKPEAKKKAFARSRNALMDMEIVSCFGGFYWKR